MTDGSKQAQQQAKEDIGKQWSKPLSEAECKKAGKRTKKQAGSRKWQGSKQAYAQACKLHSEPLG